ncbi:hypothetical protein BDR04DRAFT_1090288 [Suillus decipiens]|nr:hypothetical protein BDR04DRAFT_1090288 [Suillus decipiens]
MYSLHYGMLPIEKTLRKRGFMCKKLRGPDTYASESPWTRSTEEIRNIYQNNIAEKFTLISLFPWMNQPATG